MFRRYSPNWFRIPVIELEKKFMFSVGSFVSTIYANILIKLVTLFQF